MGTILTCPQVFELLIPIDKKKGKAQDFRSMERDEWVRNVEAFKMFRFWRDKCLKQTPVNLTTPESECVNLSS